MNKISYISWYCPNCGKIVCSSFDKEGFARITCNKCGTHLVMHHKSRRQSRLDMIAPTGQQIVCG